MNAQQLLLHSLRRLEQDGPSNKLHGICSEVSGYAEQAITHFSPVFKAKRLARTVLMMQDLFELLGYEPNYPVPYPASWQHKVYEWAVEDEGIDQPQQVHLNRAAYEMTANKWSGEYGESRRAVLRDLIKYLEEQERVEAANPR